MNVTQANKIVQAINTIVTGYTSLSRAIEDLAWESFEDHAGMPGARPIAALQLAQPALEDAADEYDTTHQQAPPEPTQAEEPEPVSLEQVRAVLAKLSQAGHTTKVHELIRPLVQESSPRLHPRSMGGCWNGRRRLLMPDQHALLSASGAHRWLACPPSATLEAGLPESSSQAAEQGTAAHALAEWKLRRALHDAPTIKPVSGWIDAEMDALTDDYVAFIQERLRDVRQTCADPQVLIEQRLDFSHVVPGGFGTGDAVIITEPMLQIIDLKYGQGVLVEAERNPQLMLYALGAVNAFGSLYDIDEVALTIYQSRRANISTWQVSVTELQAWAARSSNQPPRSQLAVVVSLPLVSGAGSANSTPPAEPALKPTSRLPNMSLPHRQSSTTARSQLCSHSCHSSRPGRQTLRRMRCRWR